MILVCTVRSMIFSAHCLLTQNPGLLLHSQPCISQAKTTGEHHISQGCGEHPGPALGQGAPGPRDDCKGKGLLPVVVWMNGAAMSFIVKNLWMLELTCLKLA